MYNGTLRPQGIRSTFVNLSSEMDLQWESAQHNPANVEIALPNASRTKKVWKLTPHTTVIPRMFPNIYAPDNVLTWYQRQVLELPTADPTIWLRTVDEKWTETRRLVFPPRIWNVDAILVFINAALVGTGQVWTFDPVTLSFVVTVTPSAPAIVFGFFVDGAHVPPAVTYANMTYIVEPFFPTETHLFNVLGFERVASTLTSLPLSLSFNPLDPNTFDNLFRSNLSDRNAFPLFDRTSRSYAVWAVAVYVSPQNNQPNLAGPTVVHVAITDLGDSSTVDAGSGLLLDIITTLNLADVDFGMFKERIVNDQDAEAIEYQQARDVSKFRITVLDSKNRQLALPRNFPVFLKVQLIHTLE